MFGYSIKWNENFVSIFNKFDFDVYFHLYTSPFEEKKVYFVKNLAGYKHENYILSIQSIEKIRYTLYSKYLQSWLQS